MEDKRIINALYHVILSNMSQHHLSATLTQVSYRFIGRRRYTSSTHHLRNQDSSDYSKTVFVPRSKFPSRHNPRIELEIQEDAKFSQTYIEQDPARKSFIIHDGPPFANGQIHLGHAINKILKDIAARYAMITGHRVEFITGWDCHGLPIEMQVIKLLEEQQKRSNYGGSLLLESTGSPEYFRTRARSYAKSQIDLQMASFKRMGLLTDWNKRYTTDDPSYVANQLRAFSQLFDQKLIFKDLMPVNWSLANQTTVADADIDYRPNHISKSAYILFELIDPNFHSDVTGQPIYSLVWTTTPWTVLENRAIAFNKQETYCILKAWKASPDETKNFLTSLDTVHKAQGLLQRLGFQFEIKTYLPGHSLAGLKYKPLLNELGPSEHPDAAPLPFLHADFVDGAKGTGLVHISPNYGQEDFELIKKNKLPFKSSLVDTSGRFKDEVGDPLAGKHIFTDGNQEIINLLDQRNALLFTEMTQHSYAYETRTNQPIMVRASQQIFLNNSIIIPKCLKALKSCSFFPEAHRQQLINTLGSSPNWCISRQRLWGTPIPVLYEANDTERAKMISHPMIVEHFCKLLYKKRFMDYWWTADQNELLPQDLLDKCKLPYKSADLVRGSDIFDVWSDSGLSWHTTTNSLNDSQTQADLYLEGVDQIRGWFSASSILSMALRGCLPSKRFFLHGFALDERGRKMSKSQGNVIDPIRLFEDYGVDPVRLWAAKAAGCNRDICVRSKDFSGSINDIIHRTRITFKYLIGALVDHDAIEKELDQTKMEIFDQYYLDKLYRFASTLDQHYRSYRFDLVVKSVSKFLTDDLSPIYLTTMKDIIYCDELESARRKSCLTVLNLTYNILLRCLYPLLPHIVHEAGHYMRPSEPLSDWQNLGFKAAWKNDAIHSQFETLIKLRGILVKSLGSRFDMMRDHDSLLLLSDKKLFKHLNKIANQNSDLMTELFKTSTFIVGHDDRLCQPDEVDKSSKTLDIPMGSSDQESLEGEKNQEEAVNINVLSTWTKETSGGYRVGASISINGASQSNIEMCYKKSSNRKCLRCRRFTVLDVHEHSNVCYRCKSALLKLGLET